MTTEILLHVEDLRVHFPVNQGLRAFGRPGLLVRAVDGVSFDIRTGEILALVGESGSGKTTIAKAIVRLLNPTTGQVVYRGQDLARIPGSDVRRLRQRIQIIFQDPYESLDPRQSVFETVAEPLIIHGRGAGKKERENMVYAALEAVGLQPASEIAACYPHQLSGGQRQRVAIAAALVLNPDFIVADEPVSMLDASIRAETLRLMFELRGAKGLTYLFVTHDLSLAWMIADRIVVLYLGKILEAGPVEEIIHHPFHPYTKALVSVIPVPEPDRTRQQIILVGETPSPIAIQPGCRFAPRCWLRSQLGNPQECTTREPSLQVVGTDHVTACHFAERA